MIKRLSVATIWVKDLDEALEFYRDKVGLEVRADFTNYDYRWLTVGSPSQPDIDYHLAPLKPGYELSQDEVDQLTRLVAAGKLGVGPWKTDNCQQTYETLKARGVEFVQPPTDQPYGTIEAIFTDPSGNVMVLSQDK